MYSFSPAMDYGMEYGVADARLLSIASARGYKLVPLCRKAPKENSVRTSSLMDEDRSVFGREEKNDAHHRIHNHPAVHRIKYYLRIAVYIAMAVGWVILIGYPIYQEYVDPTFSKSERARQISYESKIPVLSSSPAYRHLVDHASKHAGWADDKTFSEWYNDHPNRVYQNHRSFYETKVNGHPADFARGAQMNLNP
jgi:hypothetical protein